MSEFEEVIDGVIEEVVFENDDTGYRVFNVNCDGILYTLVATCPPLYAGESVTASGEWKQHAAYGRQFVCSDIEKSFPYELDGILKFLASGAVKGIGPSTAHKIVDAYGVDSFYVIENEPDRLTSIRGISKEKARTMSDSFKTTLGIRDIMMQLNSYNISPNTAVSIYKKFGAFALDIINQNPYKLWEEVEDFSFQLADKIALENGFEPDCELRLKYFIKYILTHNLLNGHSFLPFEKLVQISASNIGVPTDEAENCISSMLSSGELFSAEIGSVRTIYLPALFIAENYVAKKLFDISASNNSTVSNLDKHIDLLESRLGITYADNQREAIRRSVESKCLIITGGPGTGKTTTLNGIIRLFENLNFNITLCAPTGRAAKRMSDVCGREAKTIHRLLEVDMVKQNTFIKNESNPLKTDVVIIDEMSMVDIRLFEALLRATPAYARLIMVGDSDQLPSVGAGNVFSDIIRSGTISTVFLNEVFRQASQSKIVINAHKINKGEYPDTSNSEDFFFIKKSTAESITNAVCTLVSERIPQKYGVDVLNGLQVISPTKKTPTGTQNINELLREIVNPESKMKAQTEIKGKIYRVGDKVMQIKNNYDIVCRCKNGTYETGVFNGDIGVIQNIDLRERQIYVNFEDKVASYEFNEADQLELAYAVTVHKSQGSEFDIVLLVLSDMTPLLQYRNLLYTAVTRAKKVLLIVGNEQVLCRMVDNNKRNNRYSGLKYILIKHFNKE